MKAKTLDLLIDLMDDIVTENQSYGTHRPMLAKALQNAGISRREVSLTLNWLDDIIEGPTIVWETKDASTQYAERIFTRTETNKISLASKQFLKKLENLRIINTITRERIIDSVMACETGEVTFEQLQWIAYMVIANHTGSNAEFELLESIFDAPKDHTITKH